MMFLFDKEGILLEEKKPTKQFLISFIKSVIKKHIIISFITTTNAIIHNLRY